jgi:hypothetical protein
MDVALLLPFHSNKARQTAASHDAKRRAKIGRGSNPTRGVTSSIKRFDTSYVRLATHPTTWSFTMPVACMNA